MPNESPRNADVAKHEGEDGLVRGDHDHRARVNEGISDPRPRNIVADGETRQDLLDRRVAYNPTSDVEGTPTESPIVPAHRGRYIDPVNNPDNAPSSNAQVDITQNADNGTADGPREEADPRPPASGDIEEYKGNDASPENEVTHAPFVDPVNAEDHAPEDDDEAPLVEQEPDPSMVHDEHGGEDPTVSEPENTDPDPAPDADTPNPDDSL